MKDYERYMKRLWDGISRGHKAGNKLWGRDQKEGEYIS